MVDIIMIRLIMIDTEIQKYIKREFSLLDLVTRISKTILNE